MSFALHGECPDEAGRWNTTSAALLRGVGPVDGIAFRLGMHEIVRVPSEVEDERYTYSKGTQLKGFGNENVYGYGYERWEQSRQVPNGGTRASASDLWRAAAFPSMAPCDKSRGGGFDSDGLRTIRLVHLACHP